MYERGHWARLTLLKRATRTMHAIAADASIMFAGNADLTIGLPVYNGSGSLDRALESLLAQTYRNFVLYISDNDSTDSTSQLCLRLADRDPRIVYFRQPKNIGQSNNFRFVLKKATTPFFMWACHDDWWHPTYIEKTLSALKNDSKAIACVSMIGNCREGTQEGISRGTYPLMGSVTENMRRYWVNPEDVSRQFAVYRTEVIQRCYPEFAQFHAFDYVVVGLTLQYGTYIEVPEVLMWREMPDEDRYLKMLDKKMLLFRIFPALPLSYYMLRHCNFRYFGAFLRPLLSTNVTSHRWYMSTRLPHAVVKLARFLPWLYPAYCVEAAKKRLTRLDESRT